MDCIFCKIAAGETDTELVWEDKDTVIFADIHPKAPVHFLILPRKHIASIKNLREEHKNMVSELIFAARDVAAEQGLAGYKLIFNVGREGGQVVDHLHLHLLGGWGSKGDRGKLPV